MPFEPVSKPFVPGSILPFEPGQSEIASDDDREYQTGRDHDREYHMPQKVEIKDDNKMMFYFF